MTRRTSKLKEFDPEIERTLRALIRERGSVVVMADNQNQNQMQNQILLRDYAMPNVNGTQTSIARPAVNANNFE